MRDPGCHPPHDASIDVKADQRVPDVVRHVDHRIKTTSMCSSIVADDDAELDGIDHQSSIDVMRVVVVPQLGGRG
jgi:hypothetical protein